MAKHKPKMWRAAGPFNPQPGLTPHRRIVSSGARGNRLSSMPQLRADDTGP
jgi:hypothetical protein